jgi:hypothetical protein
LTIDTDIVRRFTAMICKSRARKLPENGRDPS